MFALIKRQFRRLLRKRDSPPPGKLNFRYIENIATFREHMDREYAGVEKMERDVLKENPGPRFSIPGFCWIDQEHVDFDVDYLYASAENAIPNWRERLTCPKCQLNNRQRAALHLASAALGLRTNSRTYITEQASPLFNVMRQRFPFLTGSEYLGESAVPGSTNSRGIRHEDLTNLSFESDSLDVVLSFDVLEHIPNYSHALRECHRVLASGGSLMFSIPFCEDRIESRPRAHFHDGVLIHDSAPIYHGDPINPDKGILCFHDFGWDILELLRGLGFSSAQSIVYHSLPYGYLGGWQILFVAKK